jgi:regulator of replication initiation timing
MTDADITIARLQQENDNLRAENNALRPRLSYLEHKLRLAERHHSHEHHPHDLPPDTVHG